MKFSRIIGLAALLMVGASSASAQVYYDMVQMTGQSGYRSEIYETVTTADFLRAPANGVQRLAFTRGSAFTATVYACETKSPTDPATAGTCTSVATLSATNPSILVTTGRAWLIVDVTAAETAGNVSYLTIRSHSTQQLSGDAGGGGGIIGWPTLENLGGTGRPTQALVIDTLITSMMSSGAGRDDNGSIFTSGCVADAVSDMPCRLGSTARTIVDLSTPRAQFGVNFIPDWTDTDMSMLCRNSSNFLHATGVGTAAITTNIDDKIMAVLHDTSEDLYRYVPIDLASGPDCVAETGNISVFTELWYDSEAADTLGLFIADSVHIGLYGSRWMAQQVLLSAWEDKYPEELGVSNLVANGYMETNCTAGAPLTLSTGTVAVDTRSATVPRWNPVVGQGCRWSGMSAGATATTAQIPAAHSYYTGSIFVHSEAVSTARNLEIRIRDQSGTAITTVDWWVESSGTGKIEHVETIDSGSQTTGELDIRERGVYGGATFKFKVQIPNSVTAFDIQIENNATSAFGIDEIWVRPSVHAGLSRNYIIQDGKAEIQIFTDSRGLYGRFIEGMDYMTGFSTTNEASPGARTASVRPDLYLTQAPSTDARVVSGESLGNIVGTLNYAGSAVTNPLSGSISGTPHYCIAFYGVNDQISGNARPTSAALASDVGNEHLYWSDTIRDFEKVAEEAGCIPLVVMDTISRGDTSLTSCKDEAGSAVNCATWYNEAWENHLHNIQ